MHESRTVVNFVCSSISFLAVETFAEKEERCDLIHTKVGRVFGFVPFLSAALSF